MLLMSGIWVDSIDTMILSVVLLTICIFWLVLIAAVLTSWEIRYFWLSVRFLLKYWFFSSCAQDQNVCSTESNLAAWKAQDRNPRRSWQVIFSVRFVGQKNLGLSETILDSQYDISCPTSNAAHDGALFKHNKIRPGVQQLLRNYWANSESVFDSAFHKTVRCWAFIQASRNLWERVGMFDSRCCSLFLDLYNLLSGCQYRRRTRSYYFYRRRRHETGDQLYSELRFWLRCSWSGQCV